MVNSKANHGSAVGSDHSQQHTMFDNKKHKAEVDTGAPKKVEDTDSVTTADDGIPDFFPSQGVVPTVQSTPIPIEMMPEGKTYSYSPKDGSSTKKVANQKGSSTHFVSLHPTAVPSSASHHHIPTSTPSVSPSSSLHTHTSKPHSRTAAPTPTHRTKAPTKATGKTMAPTKRKKQFDNGDQFRMIGDADGTPEPSPSVASWVRDGDENGNGNSTEPEPPVPPMELHFLGNGSVPDPSAPPMESFYFLGNGSVPDPSAPPIEMHFLGNGTEPEPPIGPPASMIASSSLRHVPISNPISENPVVLVLGASLFAVMGAFFYRRYKVRQGYTPIPTSEPNDIPSIYDI